MRAWLCVCFFAGLLAANAEEGVPGPAPAAPPAETAAQPLAAPAKADASKHAWARFGVGTTHMTRHLIMAGKETKAEETGSAELAAVGEKDCTVIVYQGTGEKRVKVAEVKYLLLAPECILMDARTQEQFDALKVVGREEVKAAGKAWNCTVYEFSRKGEPLMQQIAVAESGLRIRTVTGTNEGGKLTRPIVEILVKEQATLSGKDRKLECQVYEAEDKELGEKTVLWVSSSVPGGLVRSETASKDEQGNEVREILEVTDWKAVEHK